MPPQGVDSRMAASRHIPQSRRLSEDQGQKQVLPVQSVPALVAAMEQQRFASVGVKGGCGHRGEEDNSLPVVGIYNKEISDSH